MQWQLEPDKGPAKTIRKMLGIKCSLGQSLEEYMIATNRTSKGKERHSVVNLDVVALRNHFHWGGFVSRRNQEEPESLLSLVLRYRDRDWCASVEAQNNGRQLHCRKLCI